MTAFSVLSSYSLLQEIHRDHMELPDLSASVAELCGSRIRRVDRYIELCLMGALSCVKGQELHERTAIYLATRGGTVETPSHAMHSIFQLQQPPKPLHFVNTLGNTACFYLTRALGTQGQTLVVSQEQTSFEAALLQATVDLKLGLADTALVGGIDEVTLPFVHHAKRLGAPDAGTLLEGSHWLLLTKRQNGGPAVSTPAYLQSLDEVLAWLAKQPAGAVHTSFAASAQERQVLEATGRTVVDASAETRHGAAPHGVYSGATLVELLDQVGLPLIHLGRSETSYCGVFASR